MTLQTTSDQLNHLESHEGRWTLAQDNALYSALDSFTSDLVNRFDDQGKRIEKTAIEIGRSSVRIAQLNTQLSAYKSNRFIENRVHDDSPSSTQPSLPDSEAVLSASEKQQETINAIKEAVAIGFEVIDNAYKRIDCSPEDFEADHSFVPDSIYEPLDPYLIRPFPYLIGSEEFMKSAYVGLVEPQNSNSAENDEHVVIGLPVSNPPTFLENNTHVPPVPTGLPAPSVPSESAPNSSSAAPQTERRLPVDNTNVKSQKASIPPPVPRNVVIPRVTSTFSDSESDSSDSLFGTSSNRVQPPPQIKHVEQPKCEDEDSTIKSLTPAKPEVLPPAVPGDSAKRSLDVETRSSISKVSSLSNSPSPSPDPSQVSSKSAAGDTSKSVSEHAKVQPSIVSQRPRTTPLSGGQQKPSPVSSIRSMPPSTSIFDDSDSDSDLFSSRAVSRPQSQKPHSTAPAGESAGATGRVNTTKVDSAFNNRHSESVAPRTRSAAKPTQSLFDDSSDSDDDLFGSGSSQNMKLPFGLGRKKSFTPEVPAVPKQAFQADKTTKKYPHSTSDKAKPETVVHRLKDPLIAENSPSVDHQNKESAKIDTAVVLKEEESTEKKTTKDDQPDSSQDKTMSSVGRPSNVSSLKAKGKVNDLFAAKLSAALGQGPPKPKPKAEPKPESAVPSEVVVNDDEPKTAQNGTVSSNSNNLSTILKARPKGPANRRPKSVIRPLENVSDEAEEIIPRSTEPPQPSTELASDKKETRKPELMEKQEVVPPVENIENKLPTPEIADNVQKKTGKPVGTNRTSNSLFDDSEDDDDLFASASTRKGSNEAPKSSLEKSLKSVPDVPKPQKAISTTTANKSTVKAVPQKKPGLFDDSDSDSDLFK